jgi:hypothetical protein
MYNITARDIACMYCMVLTLDMVLCQLKKQYGVGCSRRCWKDLWLAEDLHLCDSVVHRAFPPFFNPPPSIPPNILMTEINNERNNTLSVAKPLFTCPSK